MKSSQKLTLAGLLALLGVAVTGWVLTGRPPARGANSKQASGVLNDQALFASEQLLSTAHNLSAFAVTPEERQLAPQAVRLADRDVDLAFADALRRASRESPPSTSEVATLQGRIARLQSKIQATKDKISRLKAETAHAKGARLGGLESQLEFAEAELDLQKDTFGDAQNDLTRSGGSAYEQIEQLWRQHEATQHSKEASAPDVAVNESTQAASISGGLITRFHTWLSLRAQQSQLLRARRGSLHAAEVLTQEHQALEQRAQAAQSGGEARAPAARGSIKGSQKAAAGNSAAATAATLNHLHHLSQDEKNLADLDTRILDLRQLSALYAQWAALVQVRQRAVLHALILRALWVLLAILIAYLVGQLLSRALARLGLDRRQRMTLHTVTRFSLDVLTVLVILVIIFGSPRNMPTIVGLASAGLAVALQDFIVAFFGWFILMGRHGIHVGDWVEINGVRGEVVEITLLRTVLLETGNWNEPGHPTGRKVSFLNRYAVEGCYFNFTTSGQWLWDEIRVLIPGGLDPYAIIARLEQAIEKETKRHAEAAHREWQRIAHGYSGKTFSALSNISLRTVSEGVEVVIHYISPAADRFDLRSRLSQTAVKLIREAKASAPAAEPAEPVLAASPEAQPIPAADS